MRRGQGTSSEAGEKTPSASRPRFQTEVHVGILGIIFLLLFLNFASNYLILSARSARRQAVSAQLESAARHVERTLAERGPGSIIGEMQSDIMQTHRLSNLTVYPSAPADNTPESRRAWFASVARGVPAAEIPALAERLLESDPGDLTRGPGAEYSRLRLAETPTERYLVYLSCSSPELARLDDIYRLAMLMAFIALSATAAVYVLLSRLIFGPFRKAKEEARLAGRVVDQSEDDVDALLDDYRRMIEELCLKERELIDLNAVLSRHADSLEQFNRYLLESMRSGLITVDRDSVVKGINAAACRMLGFADDEAVDRPSGEVLARQPQLAWIIAETLSGKLRGEYAELTVVSTDGRGLVVGASTSIVVDSHGEPIGAAMILHDITEITHLRAELETRNRLAALGEMSGGLAHQLRNSLGAISGYLTLLKRRLGKQGVEEASLDSLTDETAQADLLVRRFLEFARPLQLDPQSVDLARLIHDTAAAFRMRNEYRHIEIIVGGIPALFLQADPLLLKQALINLLENAANAYGPSAVGAAVNIEFSRSAEHITITVRDRACGIPSDQLGKIFTPFYSSRPSGTGLGLPLVSKIVDLHGGRVDLQSTVGEGSVFSLVLPLAATPAPAVISARAPASV